MKNYLLFKKCMLLFVIALCGTHASATKYTVNSQSSFNNAEGAASSGDTLMWDDGTYADIYMDIDKDNLVVIPQTLGGVTFNGNSHMRIDGDSITFSGFQFVGGEYFGIIMEVGGDYNEVTHVNMRDIGAEKYLEVESSAAHNLFEYCNFENKIPIILDKNVVSVLVDPNNPGYNTLRYCSFLNFSGMGRDEGVEPIRIGLSSQGSYISRTTVEYCYFENCDGDGEIISHKSRQNVYRYNTFRNNAYGELVLRHGKESVVYGNFFINNYGGVRITEDSDHYVFSNYFYNIANRALDIRNSPKNPLSNILIANNSFINSAAIRLGGEGEAPPNHVEFANNLFFRSSSTALFRGDTTGTETFVGNIGYGYLGLNENVYPTGVSYQDPKLNTFANDSNRLYPIQASSPLINASVAYSQSIPSFDPRLGIDTLISYDVLGHLRSNSDIGAQEYTGASTIAPQATLYNTGPSYLADRPIFQNLVGYADAPEADTTRIFFDANAIATEGGTADVGITYSLTGKDSAFFNLNTSTGELNFINAPDFEDPQDNETPGVASNNRYQVAILAEDASGQETKLELTVRVSSETPTSGYSIADAYVRGGTYADSTFGDESKLIAKDPATNADFRRKSFLKFDLSELPKEVYSAKIRLYTEKGSDGINHFYLADDNWQESSITWNNQPTTGAYITSDSTGVLGNYVTIDITEEYKSEFASDSTLSIVVIDEDAANVLTEYGSKEGKAFSFMQPILLVTPEVPLKKREYVYIARDDAYVRGGGNSGNNYGDLSTVRVKKSAGTADVDRMGLWEFDLRSYRYAGFDSAKVELNGYATSATTAAFYQIDDDSWREGSVTWNTAPSFSKKLSDVNVGTSSATLSIDVTSTVDSTFETDQRYSFGMRDDLSQNDLIYLVSKDDPSADETNVPKLILTNHLILNATQDSYVNAGTLSDSNFGSDTRLRIKVGSPSVTREGYIGFYGLDTVSSPDLVFSAKLHFTGRLTTAATTTLGVYEAANVWDQGTITDNNKPIQGAYLNDVEVSGDTDSAYVVDVTEYMRSMVSAGNEVSFQIKNMTTDGTHFYLRSSESSTVPYLEIILAEEDLSQGAGMLTRKAKPAWEKLEDDPIILYPNPTEDILNINYIDEIQEVYIYTLTGVLLQKVPVTALRSRGNISLGKHPAGLLLIKLIKANGDCEVQMVIKQ